MATEVHFLDFDICLTDAAQVAVFQATDYGQGQALGVIMTAPSMAAATYSATLIDAGQEATPPCITSPWFTSGDNFPINVTNFERKTGGWFGISFLFGKKHKYYWRGTFKYLPPPDANPNGPGAPDVIAQRRWIDGGEVQTGNVSISRGASRHTQGYGLTLRDWANFTRHNMGDYVAGLTNQQSWERLYIRPRVYPTAQRTFWRCRSTVQSEVGVALSITPTGQIALYAVNSVAAFDLIGTCAHTAALEEWLKIDVFVKFGTGAACYVFINGQSQMSVTSMGAEMSTAGRLHASSEIGAAAGVAVGGSLDVDDWVNADWPASAPAMLNPGPDWLSGSRIAQVRATGFGTGNVWTGDAKVLIQNPQSALGFGVTTELVNSVSGALLAVTTDYAREVQGDPNGQIGCASMLVSSYNQKASGLSGQLGYSINGAATLVSVTQPTTPGWNHAMYRPSAQAVGVDIGPLELQHTHGADTVQENCACLVAQVEVLGIFGPEDIPPTVDSFDDLLYNGATPDIHNAPYPRTPWAQSKIPPIAPIAIYAGTYVGNAAGVEISFKTPVHWLWTRRVTTLGAGTKWFSSINASHDGFNDTHIPELMVQALQDEAFVAAPGEDAQETSYKLRITGAHVQANNPGDTYAYTAISDPGGRFLRCGALKHVRGATNVDTALLDPGFTPECGFFFKEGGQANTQLYYKGPGHAAATLSNLAAAETANALSWSAGHLVSQNAFHTASAEQIAFALLRREDGNTRETDSTDPYTEVIQLASYTGDGSASRTVGLSPLSGKRPVFAIVVPHNAAAIYRDSQNLTNTSTTIPNTNITTGITGGGIDSISVGTTLNTNGIVYDVFVLPGSDVAGNGGFSVPGEFFPRPPAAPVTGPYGPLPIDPETVPPEPPPSGGGTEPTPQWPVGCTAATTALVNIALGRLGITKELVNVDTDLRPEASQARLHYALALEATLRAFPWAFATGYGNLALLGGTSTVPITWDWQYAYRVPADFLFARRLAKTDNTSRNYDDAPYTFRVANDDTGVVTGSTSGTFLYTDAEPGSFVLEYTRRPVCPASSADPLFRTAFAWRLAAEMAPGLTRDDKKTQWCMAMFKQTIDLATVTAANEKQDTVDRPDAPWVEGRD